MNTFWLWETDENQCFRAGAQFIQYFSTIFGMEQRRSILRLSWSFYKISVIIFCSKLAALFFLCLRISPFLAHFDRAEIDILKWVQNFIFFSATPYFRWRVRICNQNWLYAMLGLATWKYLFFHRPLEGVGKIVTEKSKIWKVVPTAIFYGRNEKLDW